MLAKFTYKTGDRPLPGYTIKRGIGKGGFGEVYFAISDGGKEVALKLLLNNVETELRGLQSCLNIKHTNLVQIYDLIKDADGNPWIVMEYVAGKGLDALIKEHSNGMPEEQVRKWFPQLARGVAHLHDHNIVHRDLKPANVFIEDDNAKVGDYGLCKLISDSQQLLQTQEIGTLYYMAPEVTQGVYGKSVDIYAGGIILYEMLSGKVPFDGQSAMEIISKHLTAEPDLNKIPVPYRPIVGKALQKKPEMRYASIAEMAKDVEKAGRPPKVIPVPDSPAPGLPPVVLPVKQPTDWRLIVSEICGSFGLAAVLAFLWMIPWIAVEHVMQENRDLTEYGAALFLISLTSWAVLAVSRVWHTVKAESWLMRLSYLVAGLGIGIAAAWLHGWSFEIGTPMSESAGVFSSFLADLGQACPLPGAVFCYMTFFAVGLAIPQWWRITDPGRCKRFSFWPVLVAGFGATLAALFWPESAFTGPQSWVVGFVILVATAVIVQLASPWRPPPVKTTRPVRYVLGKKGGASYVQN